MPRPRLAIASVHDQPDVTPQAELERRAKDLEAQLPDLHRQAKAEGWPSGVSPRLAYIVKRVERWRKGDERPVSVLQFADRRCLARVNPAIEDGTVIPLTQAQ